MKLTEKYFGDKHYLYKNLQKFVAQAINASPGSVAGGNSQPNPLRQSTSSVGIAASMKNIVLSQSLKGRSSIPAFSMVPPTIIQNPQISEKAVHRRVQSAAYGNMKSEQIRSVYDNKIDKKPPSAATNPSPDIKSTYKPLPLQLARRSKEERQRHKIASPIKIDCLSLKEGKR